MDEAIQLIKKYALGKKVTVACSGGEDSMALLYLMLQFYRRGELDLRVINVDHCIRKNSASDSEFVKKYCADCGIFCESVKVDVPELCAATGLGLEAQAHHVRRELFYGLVKSGSADMVATAHHGRDECETVLMHLFRGSGLKGLCGMPPLSEGGVFRPFINTPKNSVTAYVKQNKIPFVTDETNADNSYDRNYIRNVILPLIRERFPHSEEKMISAAQLLHEDCEKLYGSFEEAAFDCRDNIVALKEEFLNPAYIFEALSRLGKNYDVYRSNINAVLGLKNCRNGSRVDVGDGITASREYGYITFFKYEPPVPKPTVKFNVTGLPQTFEFCNYKITVAKAVKPYFPPAKGALTFDLDKLPDGCELRSRRISDRFTPYGGGTRKLKEYLIDKKIARRLRQDLIVLGYGSEVFAVAGVEISDKIKIDGGTVNAVTLTVEAAQNEEN